MLTFTGRRNLFGDLANNSASATLTLADTLMNVCEKRIISMRDWPFLRRQFSLETIEDTVTITTASPAVVTLTDHKLAVGSVVYFSTTGTLPTGLTAGSIYYVIRAGLTSDDFQVSASPSGTAVNTTAAGSGTHTVHTAEYVIPPYIEDVRSVYVTSGSIKYQPRLISSREEWDSLTSSRSESDQARYAFVEDGRLYLEPEPATADVVVSINAKRKARDLNVADYTTGTVDIITKGSTDVTGSSTVWTSPMEGRWLRITHSNTATASGDHEWYEIEKRVSDTSIILRKPYGGTSLTTGAAAAYTLGQCSLIPEPHDLLPVYEALKIYFTSVRPDAKKAQIYSELYNEGYAHMVRDWGSKTTGVIDDGMDGVPVNPNYFITA